MTPPSWTCPTGSRSTSPRSSERGAAAPDGLVPVRVDLTQGDLARQVGGSRQQVNRVLMSLEADGSIERLGHRIVGSGRTGSTGGLGLTRRFDHWTHIWETSIPDSGCTRVLPARRLTTSCCSLLLNGMTAAVSTKARSMAAHASLAAPVSATCCAYAASIILSIPGLQTPDWLLPMQAPMASR